jgi:hypothetical protein
LRKAKGAIYWRGTPGVCYFFNSEEEETVSIGYENLRPTREDWVP